MREFFSFFSSWTFFFFFLSSREVEKNSKRNSISFFLPPPLPVSLPNPRSYSLSLWYGGGVAVASGKRSGGEVVNALFAAMSAGLALSQAVPAGQGLALGKAAAGRLLGVIDR